MESRDEAYWTGKVAALEKFIAEQAETIKRLETALEKFLKPPKDSGNSSISPSQDRNRKYTPREKTGKQSGGQTGHKGQTRLLSDTPDTVIPLLPEYCTHCGCPHLQGLPGADEKRQVIDIPPIHPIITEYQQQRALCTRCGKTSKASFPDSVSAPVQMGAQVRALAAYLKVTHFVSLQRLSLLFSDLFGLHLSEGTLQNQLKSLSDQFKDTYLTIKTALQSAWLVLSDETTCKISGKKRYTWLFQSETLSFFLSNQGRGYSVIESVMEGNAPEFWVSDRYNAQLKVPCQHQLCLAHLLRNLKYIIQSESSQWATQLKELLQETIHFRKQGTDNYDPLLPETFRQVQLFQNRLAELFQKPPPQKEESTLFRELLGRQSSLLLFLKEPQLPFDNNASERALRRCVTHRKVTGGFRSPEGATFYDILVSVLESAKKQGLNILQVFSGKQRLAFTTTN